VRQVSRERLRIYVSLVLAAGLLTAFIVRLDVPGLRRELRDVTLYWLPAGIAANLAAQWFRGLRHHYLLRPTRSVPVTELWGSVLIGAALNNLLVLRAGSVARVQLISARWGVARSTLAANLTAEIVLDVQMMALFLFLAILLLHLGPFFGWLAATVLAVTTVLLILAWLLGRQARRGDEAVEQSLRFLPRSWRRALGQTLLGFEQGWWALWQVKHAPLLLATSAGVWVSEAGALWSFGEMVGLQLDFMEYLALLAVTNIVTSLAFTPAGLGAFQLSVSELLRQFGAGSARAGAYAVLSHALLIMTVMGAAVVAALLMRVKPGDLLYLRKAPASPLPEVEAITRAAAEMPGPALRTEVSAPGAKDPSTREKIEDIA
jgi:uncharacterized protein (TIRG00374 family)